MKKTKTETNPHLVMTEVKKWDHLSGYMLLSWQNICMKGKAYFLLWRAGVGKGFL